MKKYTVLLLRPDYLADEFGKDTFLSHVEANSVGGAIAQAQLEAWTADDCPDDNDCCDDYHVLFCTEGHLDDLSVGEPESTACPTCGADGGTSCGATNCGLLT